LAGKKSDEKEGKKRGKGKGGEEGKATMSVLFSFHFKPCKYLTFMVNEFAV